MMRLLYLCLLLRAAAVSSQEIDGSGDTDDEDDVILETFKNTTRLLEAEPDFVDMKEATGHEGSATNELFTIIIVGVCLVALLAVAVAAVVLVRRHRHNREQGIYSVPAEQGQKGAV